MDMWNDLRDLHIDDPWMLCGDFNSVMNVKERIGSLVRESEMGDMR